MKRPLYNTIGRRSDYTSPTLDYFATPVEQGFLMSNFGEPGEFPSIGEGEDFGEFE